MSLKKPAEQARNSLMAAIGSSEVGIAIFDGNLRCRAANIPFTSFTGHSVEAHIDKTVPEVFGSGLPQIELALLRVWHTARPFRNVKVSAPLSPNTETKQWVVNFFPLMDSSGWVRLVGMAISDATERYRLPQRFSAASLSQPGIVGQELESFSAKYDEVFQRCVSLLDRSMCVRRYVSEIQTAIKLSKMDAFVNVPRHVKASADSMAGWLESRKPPVKKEPSIDMDRELSDALPSPRELQIVRLVADGKSNKQIAAQLRLSTRTVEAYRARLMLKLDLHSAAEIARYAVRKHLIPA